MKEIFFRKQFKSTGEIIISMTDVDVLSTVLVWHADICMPLLLEDACLCMARMITITVSNLKERAGIV